VLREAERLVKAGVRELLVISQDTSAYGVDVKYAESRWRDRDVRTRFLDLTQELGSLGAWVRLHYVYPYPHVDEVIPLMAEGKILPYLDIPFQHASPKVLKAMRRPGNQEKTLDRIHKWRDICPDLAIRSTFIVGFPGETEEDFQELLDFIEEFRFERAGVFQYSKEEGTRAVKLDGHLHHMTRKSRWSRAMSALQKIASETNQAQVGKNVRVLVEQKGVGRTQWDAPEIDGSVMVDENLPVGSFADVKIGDWRGYDLVAAR
jgi:ribosomal protein S12 methylthiotransferase